MKIKLPELTERNIMFATVITFLLLATIITMGMFTPLIVKLASGVDISLSPGYFNERTAIPTAALVLLLSACTILSNRNRRYIIPTIGMSVALAIVFLFISPFDNAPVDIALPILTFVLIAIFSRIARIYSTGFDMPLKVRKISAHIIHIGIILILLGVILSSNMKIEGSGIVELGEMGSFEEQDYKIKINKMASYYSGESFQNYPASSYTTEIDFDIYRSGLYFDSGQIKYVTDFKWGQTHTTTYINRGITEELFIAPRAINETKGEIDIYMRTVPFINSLWAGIYLMIFGIIGVLLSDRAKGLQGTSASGKSKETYQEIYDRILEEEVRTHRSEKEADKR